MVCGADEVLAFWLDECAPEDWYKADPGFDAEIKTRFEPTWQAAMDGKLCHWLTYPTGALAYIILTDQFSRNMFRGTGKAFESDRIALKAAKLALDRDWDLKIEGAARQFLYMPLMHSENLCDQERCIRMIAERMDGDGSNLRHAQAHRDVIRRFGRFPTRNEALGRSLTTQERAYLAAGGYASTLRELQQDLAG